MLRDSRIIFSSYISFTRTYIVLKMLSLTMFALLCLVFYAIITLYVNYRSKFFDIMQRAKEKKDPYHKWRE